MVFRFTSLLLACVAVGVLLGTGTSHARVRGAAEWSYSSYTAEAGSVSLVDASDFTQRYSIFWDKRGVLAEGRGGAYDLGLGLEWVDFSSEMNGSEVSDDQLKLTYNGRFTFAPGGLPFRLEAFSYDLTPSTIDYYDIDFNRYGDGLVEPQIAAGIFGGTHIVTGISFIAGIKNGSYLGTYRELLSKYPRLLVDFHQDYVRNLNSITPEHYRTSDLAFVSLNKKKNWVHYRVQDHVDYQDSRSNYIQRQFLVGTVDHLQRREWLDLTNWIKLSVDLSLTTLREAGQSQEDTYALNLFEIMSRKGLKVGNFNTFERRAQGDNLSRELEIPFYVSIDTDPNRRYHATLIRYAKDEITERGDDSDAGTYLKGELLYGRHERILHTPRLAIEERLENGRQGRAAEFAYELWSNPEVYRQSPWALLYQGVWLDGENANGQGGSYLENKFEAKKRWNLSGWDLDGSQILLLADGDNVAGVVKYISPEAQRKNSSGSYLRATTWLEGQFRTATAMNQRLGGRFEYEREADEPSTAWLEVYHRLDYQKSLARYSAKSTLWVGDVGAKNLTADQGLLVSERSSRGTLGEVSLILSHNSGLEYAPMPNLLLKGRVNFQWSHGDVDDAWSAGITQEARYQLFTRNGLYRKKAEFYESFLYDMSSTSVEDLEQMEFRVGADWYLYRMLRLGAQAAYTAWYPENDDMLQWRVLAGLDFSKLQCELSYAYGLTRDGSDSGPAEDLTEHLVEARIRKLF